LPEFLDYRAQMRTNSILNTPPVFAIYVVLLVTRWLRDEIGGLAAMDAINTAKAAHLYRAIDESDGFYLGRAAQEDRSKMNVAFNLHTVELERQLIAEAEAAGFSGLTGHRSIGGLRASLYNGLQLSAVEMLADFMAQFQKRNR
jgi:phosphoserine aminotransferase